MSDLPLDVQAEVAAALRSGRPVVALESTVLAHGLPHPVNMQLAHDLDREVRAHGAVPAIVAVLGGRIKVGLTADELQRIATEPGVLKVSRRDLPLVVAHGLAGATTVAATMLAAHWAGIAVFATGGIGGVHRAAPQDISADLPELARTPVMVVCSGAKAILDLPATLEWLETHGVPVIGYGTSELPAFYSRASGLQLAARADTPQQVAAIVRAQRALGLGGGMLLAVPVPAAAEVPASQIEQAIATALAAAQAQHIIGAAVTPFLLQQVAAHTGGTSLQANLALLRNNAAVAAQVAAALV